jgi:DNA repair protein RadD
MLEWSFNLSNRQLPIYEARWYQDEAKAALFDYFTHKSGNPVIALPTGSGKSFVIADILRTILTYWPGQRIVVGTHVKELIDQNYNELLGIWPDAPAGIYSAGLGRRDIESITFAGVASLVSATELFGHVDLFIVDECHLVGPKDTGMYNRIFKALAAINPNLKVIGLTATPYRTGGGYLQDGPIFSDLIYNICTPAGFERLFKDGYLVPPRSIPTDFEYDVSDAKIVAGDFSQGDLHKLGKNRKHTERALAESLHRGADRHCRLVFCCGVEHAEVADQILHGMGVKSAFVHSKMASKDRDAVIAAWKAGEIDTLTNNGICTTGINHPAIDHIIMLRPTTSPGLWVQMLGRGTRPFPGKMYCLVTDHGGNAKRLGTIDAPYLRKKGKPGSAPVKICDQCGCYASIAAKECNVCGLEFPPPMISPSGFGIRPHDEKLVRGTTLTKLEDFVVDNIYYTQYLKRNPEPGTRPVLRILYRCGFQEFVEYIPFEGTGRGRGIKLWKERFPGATGAPETVNEAMAYIRYLKNPTRIRVNMAKKYPEVVHCEY